MPELKHDAHDGGAGGAGGGAIVVLPWVACWIQQVEERKTNGTQEEKEIRTFINARTREEEERQSVSMQERLLACFSIGFLNNKKSNPEAAASSPTTETTETARRDCEHIQNIPKNIALHVCTSIKYDLGGRKNSTRPPWAIEAEKKLGGRKKIAGTGKQTVEGGEASYQYLKKQVTAALTVLVQHILDRYQVEKDDGAMYAEMYTVVVSFVNALDGTVVREVTRILQEKDAADRRRMSSGSGNGTNLKTRHRSNGRKLKPRIHQKE